MADLPTLDTAKQHLRIIDDNSQDELVQDLLDRAIGRVEKFTGHLLSQREVEQVFETFGVALELTRLPAVSVTEVAYADENGDPQVYADFLPALTRTPPRIYPARDGWWPSLDQYGVVTVTYDAGYAEGEVPEGLVQAVLGLVAYWYENRGATDMPDGMRRELHGYRRALA